MKIGDMVRFAKLEEVDMTSTKAWPLVPKNHIGVLVEHNKLMGTVHILHEGEIYRLRPVFVQKAGKRDYEKNER